MVNPGQTEHSPPVTDGWKLELLEALCLDFFFSAKQAATIIATIDYADSRVTAAARVFARIVDLENWHEVAIAGLTPVQQHELHAQLGAVEVRTSGHLKVAGHLML